MEFSTFIFAICHLIHPTNTRSSGQTSVPTLKLKSSNQNIFSLAMFFPHHQEKLYLSNLQQINIQHTHTVPCYLIDCPLQSTCHPDAMHTPGTRVVWPTCHGGPRCRLFDVWGKAHYSTGPPRLGSFHQWFWLSSRGTRGIMITGSLVHLDLELSFKVRGEEGQQGAYHQQQHCVMRKKIKIDT